jgi:hypothetical protein
MSAPIKTWYRVWWEYGGYKCFDTLREARKAEHSLKGRPARIDRISIVWANEDLR